MTAGRILARAALLAVALAAAGCGSLTRIDTSCAVFPDGPGCAPAAAAAEALLPTDDGGKSDYEKRFLALLATDRLGRLDRSQGTGPFGGDFRKVASRDFQREYRELTKLADATATPEVAALGGGARSGTFDAPWRLARSTLFIDGAALPDAPGEFQFSGLQARTVEIAVVPVGEAPVTLDGACDGRIALRRGSGTRVFEPGERMVLNLAPAEGGKPAAMLLPESRLDACSFTLRSTAHPTGRKLTVRREEIADPALAKFDGRFQRCAVPETGKDALARAFYTGRWLSQTCTVPMGTPELLVDARDGFNAKVEALIGTRLPDSFFDRGDPGAPIDFSRAPTLELIYFSYLDFKADFTGRVMERLIRHHAARGAKVRILVTDILERDKDRALLRRLASDFPNVQLQEYTWDAARGAPTNEQLSMFYKTQHVKMLATRARDPGRSRVIIGGRNIHDGFLFHEPVDLSKYPELQQYGETNGLSLNYYSNWSDFEIGFSAPAAVEAFTQHIATFWHRDSETNMVRPFSVPAKGVGRPAGTARHFMSVPYADGFALEAYYIELIDAARQKIEIVNPYLNLTPPLAAAIDRALARGVKITIIGRIDMRGDLGGKFLTELNELFVEQYAGRIEMHEFTAEGVVLHSKILMIDGRLVTVSSVNLNHRSFLHDSENGIATLDRSFYKRMKAVFESYRAQSKPANLDVKVPFAYRLLFSSKQVLQAF